MTNRDFAALVKTHAARAGYDFSSPRSGGQKKLAEDTGMCHASVCRMLNGQSMPQAHFLEPLGNAIGVHVYVLLEAAGVVTRGALTGSTSVRTEPPTVSQVAEALGITSPLHVRLLETVTDMLLQDEAGVA